MLARKKTKTHLVKQIQGIVIFFLYLNFWWTVSTNIRFSVDTFYIQEKYKGYKSSLMETTLT